MILIVPVDLDSLPHDPAILKQMLVDVTTQLDKTQRLLTQLLAAKSGTRSEQLSADQLRLFAQELSAELPKAATEAEKDSEQDGRRRMLVEHDDGTKRGKQRTGASRDGIHCREGGALVRFDE